MMWGYPGYWNWGGMLIMMLSSLLWVALITVVIVLVVRRLGSRSASSMGPSHAPSAMEILEQRYARGEIDEATFQHMRDELRAEQLHASPL
ncbi:MAG: SHOCT domain-containing protein [Ktedonobacterales bacterium]